MVSKEHANFIVNLGNASYNDVSWLIDQVKDEVSSRKGIVLEEEIERWI